MFQFNDGGRGLAGYKGETGDCVVRAISIATEKSYQEIYDSLYAISWISPRKGVYKRVYETYLDSIGWKRTTTMKFGQGCKAHLKADELPPGRLIVQVSKHLVAVIDGVIQDTFDCSRDGTRCVYGYWAK